MHIVQRAEIIADDGLLPNPNVILIMNHEHSHFFIKDLKESLELNSTVRAGVYVQVETADTVIWSKDAV